MSNTPNNCCKKYSVNDDIERKLIWDEYKYRHKHIWTTVFTVTIAATAIAIIPYSQQEIAIILKEKILVLPAVAIALILFSFFRMWRELKIFNKIKKRHRYIQEKFPAELFKIDHENKTRFDLHVIIYFTALLIGSLVNLYLLWCVWLPEIIKR